MQNQVSELWSISCTSLILQHKISIREVLLLRWSSGPDDSSRIPSFCSAHLFSGPLCSWGHLHSCQVGAPLGMYYFFFFASLFIDFISCDFVYVFTWEKSKQKSPGYCFSHTCLKDYPSRQALLPGWVINNLWAFNFHKQKCLDDVNRRWVEP